MTVTQTHEARTDYESVCLRSRATDGVAIRDVLKRVADKWSLLTIVTLQEGQLRFTELQRHIPGISQRMLTLTLRQLERDGLVTRTVFAEVPPRVEYRLTELGQTLIVPAQAFASWALDHYPAIQRSRAEFDQANL